MKIEDLVVGRRYIYVYNKGNSKEIVKYTGTHIYPTDETKTVWFEFAFEVNSFATIGIMANEIGEYISDELKIKPEQLVANETYLIYTDKYVEAIFLGAKFDENLYRSNRSRIKFNQTEEHSLSDSAENKIYKFRLPQITDLNPGVSDSIEFGYRALLDWDIEKKSLPVC